MSIQNYRIFIEVCKTLNFTRAANNLYITQSAVSYAMKDLENEVGIKLFVRLTKSVSLTSAAEKLLEKVVPVINAYDSLALSIKDLDDISPIKIVSCITYGQIKLPKVIDIFKNKYPSIPMKVDVMHAKKALDRFIANEVDIAIIEGKHSVENAYIKTIGEYECIVVGSINYHNINSIDELLNEPLLVREKGSAVREVFDGFLSNKGYTCVPYLTSVDSKVLIEACKNNIGLAILPKTLVNDELELNTLKEIHIKDLKLINCVQMLVNPLSIKRRSIENLCSYIN